MKNINFNKRMGGLVMACLLTVVLLVGATPSYAAKERLVIEIANSRVMSLTAKGIDPGADLKFDQLEDNDVIGPFFTVQGDIVEINGEAATGTYICWGVFTTDFEANLAGIKPFPPIGITAINQLFFIDRRGTITTIGAEMAQESIAVVGGTGDFVGAAGSLRISGVDFPYGDGNLHVEMDLSRLHKEYSSEKNIRRGM